MFRHFKMDKGSLKKEEKGCYSGGFGFFGLRERTVAPARHISELPITFSSSASFCL
jgi:hypothetical protein